MVFIKPSYLVVFSEKIRKMAAEGGPLPHAIDPLIKREDYQTPAIPEKKSLKKWNFPDFWWFFKLKNHQKSPKAIFKIDRETGVAEGDPFKNHFFDMIPQKFKGSQSAFFDPTFCTNFVRILRRYDCPTCLPWSISPNKNTLPGQKTNAFQKNLTHEAPKTKYAQATSFSISPIENWPRKRSKKMKIKKQLLPKGARPIFRKFFQKIFEKFPRPTSPPKIFEFYKNSKIL